jgi:hypothetical protein
MSDSLKDLLAPLDLTQREQVISYVEKLNSDIDVITGGDMVKFLESLFNEEDANEQGDT